MKLFLLNAPRYLPYYISMLENANEKGVLLIIENINLLDDYLDILKKLKDSLPFVEYQVLAEKYYKVLNNDFHKIKYRKQSLNKIKSLFSKYPIDTVVTSNDGLLYAQYALYLNKNGENIYLEDGTLNYIKQRNNEQFLDKLFKTPFHNWFYPKIYFSAWKSTPGIGSNEYITHLYFSQPELISNINKPINNLKKENFIKQNKFVIALLQKFNLSKSILQEIDIMILLDRIEDKKTHKKYITKVLDICKENINKKIAIKKHPRDFRSYKNIKTLDNILFLPEIAFEFLIPVISKKTIVIGSTSTSVMLAHSLNQKTFIINSGNNSDVYKLFKKIGLQEVNHLTNIF